MLTEFELPPPQHVDWGHLPPELVALCCRALLRELQARGPISLRQAARAQAALSPNRHWRAATQGEAIFRVQLAGSDSPRIACARIGELTLPPPTGAGGPLGCDLATLDFAISLLSSPAFHARSGTCLTAVLNLPVEAAGTRVLAGWGALQQVHLAQETLPGGGGAAMKPLHPACFPSSLLALDTPVPRHPFHLADGLPLLCLRSLTLRCSQDFVLAGTPVRHVPPSWRQLAVHAGRTAGLDLGDLRHLAASPATAPASTLPDVAAPPPPLTTATAGGGSSSRGRSSASQPSQLSQHPQPPHRHLMLHAPRVMLITSDPAHAASLAAPPVRSLLGMLSQYLAVLAPALAAAGVQSLQLLASETSFYCRRPGRLAILDAAALSPAGQVHLEEAVVGYTARLAWPSAPASVPSGGAGFPSPLLCLSVERQADT